MNKTTAAVAGGKEAVKRSRLVKLAPRSLASLSHER
jgi:hypothetical protein